MTNQWPVGSLAAAQQRTRMSDEIGEIEAIYEATEPALRERMLVLLADYAKSDAVCEWAREKRAEMDPEYRLRKGLRSYLVDTLPTDPSR